MSPQVDSPSRASSARQPARLFTRSPLRHSQGIERHAPARQPPLRLQYGPVALSFALLGWLWNALQPEPRPPHVLEDRIAQLERKSAEVEARLGAFEARIAKLEVRLPDIEARLAESRKEISALDLRMQHRIEDLEQQLKELKPMLEDVRRNITELKPLLPGFKGVPEKLERLKDTAEKLERLDRSHQVLLQDFNAFVRQVRTRARLNTE